MGVRPVWLPYRSYTSRRTQIPTDLDATSRPAVPPPNESRRHLAITFQKLVLTKNEVIIPPLSKLVHALRSGKWKIGTRTRLTNECCDNCKESPERGWRRRHRQDDSSLPRYGLGVPYVERLIIITTTWHRRLSGEQAVRLPPLTGSLQSFLIRNTHRDNAFCIRKLLSGITGDGWFHGSLGLPDPPPSSLSHSTRWVQIGVNAGELNTSGVWVYIPYGEWKEERDKGYPYVPLVGNHMANWEKKIWQGF
jgi:hypothetical protein